MKLIQNYPTNKLTTLCIGGPAKYFCAVKNNSQLIEAVKIAKQKGMKYLVIGSGSNLLISDDGFDGLIIKNQISQIQQLRGLLKVTAGTTLQRLVDYSINQGFDGIHKMTGIPGTVGGAVFGNAGAYGQTISDHLIKVTAFDGSQIITLKKTECGFDYRTSNFKTNHLIILELIFKFPKQDSTVLLAASQQILKLRLAKYPIGISCPGSFFKNIPSKNIPKNIKLPFYHDTFGKIPAWAFLDKVKAEGARLGDVQIMPYHSNLIVNLGGGTAKDFYMLAKKYAVRVKQKFGIKLEPEVQLINLPPIFK